jgi:hypothetical protein
MGQNPAPLINVELKAEDCLRPTLNKGDGEFGRPTDIIMALFVSSFLSKIV